MKKLVRYRLTGDGWGDIIVHRPIPRGEDRWGILAPIRGTSWEPLIYEVTGEAFSHALHGWLKPLVNELGPPPLRIGHRIPREESVCAMLDECVIANREMCHASGPPPDCYYPPVEDPALNKAMEEVVVAWREGSYVIVVTDGEFSLS